jgi:4-hydroxybenzoate polyprenyltransferase
MAPMNATAPTLAPLPARFARLVKIEHTIFALPFAYVGAFLAVGGTPSAHDLLWITLAMVGARSLAMALNRLVDAGIDARNPRTAGREIPSGQLSIVQVVLFCAASLALFLVAVWQLAPLTHWLWPIPVAGFVLYPYLKRFTWLCHLWLGAVDGLAPIGAWVAITNHLPWEAWALGGAVAFWVAGFDFFYALFDVDVDRQQGLHSVATRFGVRGAFAFARIAHVLTVVLLVVVGLGLSVGILYWLGVALVAGLLVYEHLLVRPDDLSRLDAAFFTMNGVISVAFAVFVIADAIVG